MDYFTRKLLMEEKDPDKLVDKIIKRHQDTKIRVNGKVLEIGDILFYVVSSRRPKITLTATVLDIDHIEQVITVKVKDDGGDCILKLKSLNKLRAR